MENKTKITDETAITSNGVLSAVSFGFSYRNSHYNELDGEESFTSTKTNIIDAMQDFLSSETGELTDIDYEVEVTFSDGTEDMISVDVRQDWDGSFYFIQDEKMIAGNDIKPYKNGR